MTEERASVESPEQGEVSILQIGSLLLRHRALIARTTVLVTLATLAAVAFTPRRYTSSMSFLPQSTTGALSRLGTMASLAGQLGISVPGERGGNSPEFYAELIRSREILGQLASEELRFRVDGDGEASVRSGTLADLLGLSTSGSEATRREAAIVWLRESGVTLATGRLTGLVSVTITTPWPGLSKALADRLLALVDDFNLRTRRSQAAAERAFVQVRLAEAQDSLQTAEGRLEQFLESNRQWAGSPQLTVERERLQRRVLIQQQLFTSLSEAFEQARIAEVRDTPVITVVEQPEAPVRAAPRGRLVKLLLGLVGGVALGLMLALLREASGRARSAAAPDYQELTSLWAAFRRDLRTLGGLRRAE